MCKIYSFSSHSLSFLAATWFRLNDIETGSKISVHLLFTQSLVWYSPLQLMKIEGKNWSTKICRRPQKPTLWYFVCSLEEIQERTLITVSEETAFATFLAIAKLLWATRKARKSNMRPAGRIAHCEGLLDNQPWIFITRTLTWGGCHPFFKN